MTSILNTILITLENGEMTDSIPRDGNPSSFIGKVVGVLLLLAFLTAFGAINR